MSEERIEPSRHPKRVTCISISVSAWNWLKDQARDEADREGGRASVSAVLERIVRQAASK